MKMLPPTPTQLYFVWIKISFIMSFSIFKWLKKYYSVDQKYITEKVLYNIVEKNCLFIFKPNLFPKRDEYMGGWFIIHNVYYEVKSCINCGY